MIGTRQLSLPGRRGFAETVDRRQLMTPLLLGSSTRKSVGVEPDSAPQISAITGPNEPNASRKAGSVLGSDSDLMILRGGVALVSEENHRHGERFAFVFLDPVRTDR